MTPDLPPRALAYWPPALCLVAAALTATGSFLPLFVSTVRLGYPNVELVTTVTAWGLRATANGLPDSTNGVAPLNALPLVLAVVLLLAAVLLARRRAATAVAAAAFLTGAVATVGMQELAWKHNFEPTGVTATIPNLGVDLAVGSGFWLLVGAAVLAVAAALGALARPGAGPVGEREEPETPRLGIPVVVRLPDEPPTPPGRSAK
ncbi:MAG: hypothetical protein ACJ72N_11035 [Labedaea sp.]